MITGAAQMDGAIRVAAATGARMPQTREHIPLGQTSGRRSVHHRVPEQCEGYMVIILVNAELVEWKFVNFRPYDFPGTHADRSWFCLAVSATQSGKRKSSNWLAS